MMLNLYIRGAFAIFVLKVAVFTTCNLITVANYLKFKNVNSTFSVKHMGIFSFEVYFIIHSNLYPGNQSSYNRL